MKNIITIIKREYLAYFTSPIAYVYLLTFLSLSVWLFFKSFFLLGQATMRSFFTLMPWMFLFFIPAVSMSKWSEERKQGTLEILLTLPLRDYEIVLAKFFAGLLLILTALVLSFSIPLTVSLLGNLDWGSVVGAYLGLLFLGASYLSLGLVVSSLTENQIIAFIGGVVVCFLFFMMGTPLITGGSNSGLSQFFQYLGMSMHFESIARGVLDSRDLLYSLSFIGFFLFVNVKILSIKARR
ncbi:MAG: ABC transporter [Deltaproteobacteria bacterium CG_4_10_14_0_2_um_filter_43_8]|nr:MAG: ABC transporter [Deltaproteobacteria bacterium CG_4_10_14_0_2_um_filter_43_8]PJC63899.1 MAG: ABC transporter [Deltaproteobacteria bacterium CG_4_9_14_0_2_um_filter_42_21]